MESMDENNLVLQHFQGYAVEFDDKHDRFERISKISRDINIESKRVIFLLHTLDKKNKQDDIIHEAEWRLDNVTQYLFKDIAQELENQCPYLYHKAYRVGLEEYIEAVTFYKYISNCSIVNLEEIQKALTYKIPDNHESKTIEILVTPLTYILGIADLTGELMRQCINNLGTGDRASCYETCNFVRCMYKGFLGVSVVIPHSGINRKVSTIKQSLHKIENVCYVIKVRGSEMPNLSLVDVATKVEDDKTYKSY